MADDEDNGFGN